MAEEWRAIPGYEGLYLVSSLGAVRSLPRYRCRGGLMKTPINKNGYPEVNLTRLGAQKVHQVHALVLLAFCGPRPDGLVIRHLNGNPADPRLDNLTYGTCGENMADCVQHGRHKNRRKTHCPAGHPYDEANTYILPSRPGARYCKACAREHSKLRAKARRNAEEYSNGRGRAGAILTAAEVGIIRDMHSSGLALQRELASRFGVTEACINGIINNRAWTQAAAGSSAEAA
jgi:hypothetical protein